MTNRLPFVLALIWAWGMCTPVFGQTQYNFYFGDIHSQTWYSDGNKEKDTNTYKQPVAQAITYARDVANNMDFLGVSDHNHNEGLHMTLGYWRAGNQEADSMNQDGVFVGMRGQEWGVISGGGHVLVYGTDKLFGWDPGVYDVYVAKSNYGMLFDSVKKYGGFCYFAHPQATDYNGIFSNPYNASWDSVVVGTAMKNGPALDNISNEADPSSTVYESRYHDLLRLGYHVAPCGNQDNHYTNFGMLNQQRTVVLATSLTRANVLDALRNRRAYATEDHDLELRIEVAGHQMGEIISSTSPFAIRIVAHDRDGEHLSLIELRSGVPGSGTAPTAITSVTNQDSLSYSVSQSVNTTYYYYAYVQEPDGQRAWSAPMWITVTSAVPPVAFALSSPSNGATIQPVNGSLVWEASAGANDYDVYLDAGNPPTTLVSSGQVSTSYSYSGLSYSSAYYWKVVAKNSAGTIEATGSPWSFTTQEAPPGSFTMLSPANAAQNQQVNGTLSWEGSVGATAYDVYLSTTNPPTTPISSDQIGTSVAYSGLQTNSVYYWKVIAKNGGGSVTAIGAPWSFATLPPSPGAFGLLSPTDNSLDQPLNSALSWQTSSDAVQYDVYLDTLNPPANLVGANQTGNSFTPVGLLSSRTYYWKVVAKNASGTIVATGSPWRFTIVTLPSAFSLVSPPHQAVDQPLGGALHWGVSNNASRYTVSLDTMNAPQTIVDSTSDTTYSYSGLIPNKTYYWSITAQNVHGGTVAVNAPRSFVTGSYPLSPTNTLAAAMSTRDIHLSWADNAGDELGYRVYRSTQSNGIYVMCSNDLSPNTETFIDTGLAINQQYFYKIVAFNSFGEGNPAAISIATLAAIPGQPALSEVTYESVHTVVDPNQNPPNTLFAIKLDDNQSSMFVQIDATLGSSPVWQTFAAWGGMGGITVYGLKSCHTYSVSVNARNDDGVETIDGLLVSEQIPCFVVSNSVESDWNLVSVPVTVPDLSLLSVFPMSISNAFIFQGSYVPRTSLEYGKGYWLKFPQTSNLAISGEPRDNDSIAVGAGWNIIGSISHPIATSSLMAIPPGIIQSSFFGYDGAYAVTDTLYPLRGYWVKVGSPGKLLLRGVGGLSKVASQANFDEMLERTLISLSFEDALGEHQKLYVVSGLFDDRVIEKFELPPPPPTGSFDVRFKTNYFVAVSSDNRELSEEFPFTLQPGVSPVTISWQLSDGLNHRFSIHNGSKSISLTPSGSMHVSGNLTTLVLRGEPAMNKELPKEFALYQNYPNPFNPSTEIRYDVPSASYVEIAINNILGERVTTLVQERQESGSYSVVWSPDRAGGVYICTMRAQSGTSSSNVFLQTRKMTFVR
ncbi:MAG: CehA/McbA family metallohydrolase [Ignavibacteriae bacterium]|nr:CehA/McbA family metallohydrolase [Ignavibacteriota bacterium]